MSNSPQSPGGASTAVSDSANNQSYSLDSLSTEEFLRVVGLRVRSQRAAMSMSRKRLAEVSGVSERYLAQLESGQGNMSIALLRKVTAAIDMPLAALLSAETPDSSKQEKSDRADSGVQRNHPSESQREPYQSSGTDQLGGMPIKLVT